MIYRQSAYELAIEETAQNQKKEGKGRRRTRSVSE
jgi:hypothetical protein